MNRQLRIAMVVPPWYELPPSGYGGLEAICAALVDALVDRGHDVTLFGAGQRSGTKGHFVSTVSTAQHRRLGESMPDVLHVARVTQLLAGAGFDVIHDHTVPGPLVAGRRASPTVVTVHGAVDGELGDYYEAVGGDVRLVAISHDQRSVRPDLPWIATVHNGMKVPAAAPTPASPGPVLWLARFNPDKGPDLAIAACRAAGLPLVLAGKCNEPAEERYLSEVVAPLAGDDVDILINADRRSTTSALRAARCLLLPLRWREPFGMVMIEAMAVGVPIVALRQGSVPEIVEDGVTGIICHRAEDLPAALGRVAALDRQACVDRVRRFFSAEVMARRYEAVYRQAISDQFARATGTALARATYRLPTATLGGGHRPRVS
jgi:glycosyltransferase involved in cell wall biosynthesis